MKIIEKIEIRNFRSIKKMDLDFNSSVSIFSGVNSCGKTNILRALNLFFNDEVGFEKKLSISDFFVEKGKITSNISIKVFFNSYASERVKKQKKVPEKFSIKRTFVFRSGFFGYNQKIDGASDKQIEYCENFLKKWVKFHYIPTDRKVFFKKIYSELSEFLGSPFGFKQLKSQFDVMKNNFSTIENSLNNRDFAQLNLSDSLKERLGISGVGYALPEIRNLLKVLDFSIERKSGEKNFVSTEGDGIKFINLLQILDIFDSRYSQESRSRPYVSIWAIDEPENSLEQKNVELFKREIWDRYSKDKQIFLTSHSPEFLLEPDEYGRNKFYGFENTGGETKEIKDKNLNSSSQITESERQMLIKAMGIGMTREEKIELKKQAEDFRNKNLELEEKIKQSQKPIVFVEDKYDQIYKVIWLKLNNKKFKNTNFDEVFEKNCTFSIHPAEGATNLAGFLRAQNIDYWKKKKIIGVFDFDEEGVKQFKLINNKSCWNSKYEGDKKTCIYKKRREHDCFCAMLIPIPEELDSLADLNFPSFVEVENLLPVDFLKENNFVKEKETTGKTKYFEVLDEKKSGIWKSILSLSNDDLKNFKPLFEKIEELFKS